MYDSVFIDCVECGASIEFQSKAGDCLLLEFSEDSVPVGIAEDILGNIEACLDCGYQNKISEYLEDIHVRLNLEEFSEKSSVLEGNRKSSFIEWYEKQYHSEAEGFNIAALVLANPEKFRDLLGMEE